MKLVGSYKYLIFDFDGTVNNTSPGIYATFTAVLTRFGVDVNKVDLSRHIGPPLSDSYTHLVGPERCDEAIALHKKIYDATHAAENSFLYDGVKDMLSALKSSGRYVLAIASSKYEPHAVQSLAYHGLTKYFDYVYGQNERRGFKREVLRQLIEEQNWDRSRCLMIGDTCYDIEGAHDCGIDAVAVTYGFGKVDELRNSHPIALASSPKELSELLL